MLFPFDQGFGGGGSGGGLGPPGLPGQGVPPAGLPDEVLTKRTATDYDTEWRPGGAGDVDKAYVDAQDLLRVLKAGDTMTGDLIIRHPSAYLIVDGQTAGAFVRLSSNTIAVIELHGLTGSTINFQLPSGLSFDFVAVGANETLALTAGGAATDIIFQVNHGQKILYFTVPPRTPINPVSDDDLVRKAYVDALAGGFPDAPIDGELYGRRDGGWNIVPNGLPEAPTDGRAYGRRGSDQQWVAAPLIEAPADGEVYGRNGQAADWARVLPIAGGTMTGPIILPQVEPLADWEAVPKNYVDRLAAGGVQQLVGVIINLNGTCQFSISSGIPSPGPLPPPVPGNRGFYVISEVIGTITAGPIAGTVVDKGDWVMSDGATWFYLAVGGADFVHKIGDTMTGALIINLDGTAQNPNFLISSPATASVVDIIPNGIHIRNGALPPAVSQGVVLWVDGTGDFNVRDITTGRQVKITDIANNRLADSIPAGGIGSQVLAKLSAANWDIGWATVTGIPPGGLANQILRKLSNANFDAEWTDEATGPGGNFVLKTGDVMTGLLAIVTPVADQFVIADGSDPNAIQAHFRVHRGLGTELWQVGGTTYGLFRVWRVDDDGSLTGNLRLALDRDPVGPRDAATKNYVDNHVIGELNGLRVYIDAQDALKLGLAGGTMTGPLILAADPIANTEAATKAYVDRLVSGQAVIIGVINAATGQCQFTNNTTGPVPPANTLPLGDYLICVTGGTIPGGPAAGIVMRIGDWLITNGATWNLIAVGSGGILTTADQVTLVPAVFGANNVQAGMQNAAAQDALRLLKAGDTMTGELTHTVDGQGHTFNGGARIYKATGTGMILRKPSGGQQFQIEENNGSNRVAIATAADLAGKVNRTGDTITGVLNINAGGINLNNCNIYIKGGAPSGNMAAVNFYDNREYLLAQLLPSASGAIVGGQAEATLKFITVNGGWGLRTAFEIQVNSPPRVRFEGPITAQSYANNSDRRLKKNVQAADPEHTHEQFEQLRPIRYQWREGSDIRPKWGFVADEVPAELVETSNDSDGHEQKGYDITQVLALAVAEIKRLAHKVAELEARLQSA